MHIYYYLVKLSLYCSTFSMCSDLLLYPLDTIETKIKANQKSFTTTRQCVSKIIRMEGIRGFYRGSNTIVFISFLPNIVSFWCYETFNRIFINLLNQKNKDLKYVLPFFTSALSELVVSFIYVPFDVIRTRLQANHPDY